MEEETKKTEVVDQVENTMEDVKKKEKNKKEKVKHDKEKEELRLANIELKEKILRITAEMQNMKKRSEADLATAYKYDGADLAEKILPVLDNFERALSIKQEGAEKFLSGFKMIYENLVNILNEKGIHEIEVVGSLFDPNIMNAVLTEQNNEVDDNIVLECLQKGYMYNDKLIRPAMVKVNEREND